MITKEQLKIYLPLVCIGIGASLATYTLYTRLADRKNIQLADGFTKANKKRKKIIKELYNAILQSNKTVFFNKHLRANVHITGYSRRETSEHAAKSQKSTQAVLHLQEIIENAIPHKNEQWIMQIKKNNTSQSEFVNIIRLYHDISDIGEIKLTIGVKRSGKHIQYCVTAVE